LNVPARSTTGWWDDLGPPAILIVIRAPGAHPRPCTTNVVFPSPEGWFTRIAGLPGGQSA
jgi:hypothetical protein